MELFNSLCRLCLDKRGELNLFEIENLANDIEIHMGFKVHLIDELPKCICRKCLEVIKNAKELREIALRNNTRLKCIHKRSEICTGKIQDHRNPKETSLYNEPMETDILKNTEQEGLSKVSKQHDANHNEHTNEGTFKKEKSSRNSSPHRPVKIGVRKDLFPSKVQQSYSKSEEALKNRIQTQTAVTFSEMLVQPHESVIKKVGKPEHEFSAFQTNLQCPICYKSFDKWKKFYLHQKTHAKAYECPINDCEKRFASKGDLEKHIRVHTGERPYECHICLKRFTQRCTLKSHYENLHATTMSIQTIQPMPIDVNKIDI